jgi:hypothetical protein
MPTSLLRWLRSRATRDRLQGVTELPVARLVLELADGDVRGNPVTGSTVLAYRIELGFVREALLGPKGWNDVPVLGLEFRKATEDAALPSLGLRSRDGVRVFVRANTYTLVDDVTTSGAPLDPRHPYAAKLPWSGLAGHLPGYRSFSVAPGQVIAVRGALRTIETGPGAYRGDPTLGCSLELYDPAGGALVLHDLVGHPGFGG